MTTIDERIEAAKALIGYTPGPWECFHGLQTDNWHSAVYGPAGDYDALLIAVCNQNDSHRADTVLIAAAPDLHRLALDLAAERERLLAICRDVPGVLNAAFAAGAEECEGGSARRQEKAMASVDDMLKRIRAAFAADPAPQPDADEREALVRVVEATGPIYSTVDPETVVDPETIADALLAAGWTRKREADALIEAERRGAERMRERAAAIADQFDAKRFYETYRAEYNRKRYDVAGVERMQRKALNIQAEDARDAIRALPLTEENTDDE